MNKKLQFFFAAAFVFASNVSAQIFYVDATNGNDGWTGSLPDAQATDGPWRTLSKVNNSSFLPGDSILFKCGGVWREQLDIPSSGSVANPILYGAYGAQCDNTNKPKFSGADIVSNWSLQSGNIYSALSILTKHSPNLVKNGTFDNDYNSWGAYLSTRAISSDCGGYGNCLSIVATGAGGLAASSPFKLVSGNNYRISFRMRATENINTTVTVRMATSPYDAAGFNKSIAVSTNWQSYTYDFLASLSLENAKIDFYAATKEIFIDDVRIFSITAVPDSVKQIYVDNSFINLAQYPNPIVDPEFKTVV